MSNTLRIAICVMGALLATDAFAQAANEAPEAAAPAEEAVAAEETPAVAETVVEETVVEEVVEPPVEATEDVASDEPAPGSERNEKDPLYWAKLRDVYTVQKRVFQKQGRFAATVYGGLIPNNAFEKYVPVGVRLNYFVLENIGLELATSYAFKVTTGLEAQIRESSPGLSAQQVLVGDTQLSHTNFGIIWSPFYGKTAFYDSALNYFDLYLFAGAGLVITETQPDFNALPEKEFKPEGALGAGLAYYLGTSAAIRLDFRQFVFQKVAGVGGVATPSEVSAGFGWFF
ncbi:MAG: outer membrane beta-barrel domain-containing protein [bacterium]